MVPYLRSVSSPYEEHSPKLTDRVEMKTADFVKTMQQKFDGLKIDAKDIPSAIQVLETSQGGKVISVRIGNKVVSGREVRAALGLNSTDFKDRLPRGYRCYYHHWIRPWCRNEPVRC